MINFRILIKSILTNRTFKKAYYNTLYVCLTVKLSVLSYTLDLISENYHSIFNIKIILMQKENRIS